MKKHAISFKGICFLAMFDVQLFQKNGYFLKLWLLSLLKYYLKTSLTYSCACCIQTYGIFVLCKEFPLKLSGVKTGGPVAETLCKVAKSTLFLKGKLNFVVVFYVYCGKFFLLTYLNLLFAL